MEQCAGKITERCQGLPLATVTAARVAASREQNKEEWEKVYQGLSWEMTKHNRMFETVDIVENILNYSFKDLPYYLRNCLLYCSIFPKDYLIKRKRPNLVVGRRRF